MTLVIKENINLSKYTTFKTGGVARYFVEVKDEEDVKLAGSFAKQNSLPVLVIGGGSNLLVSDEGFTGLVILNSIKGQKYTKLKDNSILLEANSGEIFDEVIAQSVSRGYWGLENLSAIPGTIGATPIQNVGAYGCEIGELISEVEAIDLYSGDKKIFNKSECRFGYRESIFKTEVYKNFFITKIFLKLNCEANPKLAYADLKKIFQDNSPTLEQIRDTVINIRSKKFPDWKIVGTAGSFFKNPIISSKEAGDLISTFPNVPIYEMGDNTVKISLGYLLDKVCGLKGYREGNVGLYTEQALVLVNYGAATGTEIVALSRNIQQTILEKFGIAIEAEVNII